MINKQEIMEEAKKHNLPPNTIEKDYVLSWLLAGISESKQLLLICTLMGPFELHTNGTTRIAP